MPGPASPPPPPGAARVLSFERDAWEALDRMTLGVRRKLDLAGQKLSLEAWQALPRDARRALRDAGPEAFPELLRECAARAGVRLTPLPLPEGGPPWRSAAVPEAVRARLAALGAAIDAAAWGALDDEARYVLLKLAEKQREPERFTAAAGELGIGLIPARAGDKGPAS